MNLETQLKLQSFLDGELPPEEARSVANLIHCDPAAAALLAELKDIRQAVRQAEPPATLSVTREFYWSQIQREIVRLDAPSPAHQGFNLLAKLRFLVLPAAAAAVLLIVGLVLHFEAPKPVVAKNTITGHTNASATAKLNPGETALANTATNHNFAR